jgi:hypothetical protein
MAYYAKINEDNMVVAIHTIHNNELLVDGVEVESKGVEFLVSLYGEANWKQTSYNGNMRKNYAGIGYTYRSDIDAFVPPQPFASWTLNADAQWEAPVAMPTDGEMYSWDEATTSWVAQNG